LDVFGGNHRDLWQLEPQHDIYGGRQLNIKNGVRDMPRKPTEAAPRLLPETRCSALLVSLCSRQYC
jgi:hypothetical protein